MINAIENLLNPSRVVAITIGVYKLPLNPEDKG